MDKSILLILEDIQRNMGKAGFSGNRKEKFNNEIKFLEEQYNNIEDFSSKKEIYDSIIKKGRELTKESNIKDFKKVEYYLGYCHAALYDFKGGLNTLNWLIRSYLISCALFIALAPQYLGSLVPLILLVPIYMGLRGMKKRSKTGLMYGMSAMPMALLTSVMVIKFELLNNYKDFAGHVMTRAAEINRSPEFTRNFMLIILLLSVVMLASSIFTIATGIKHRKMFI